MAWEEFTRDLASGINEASDPINLSGLEQQHLPSVSAPSIVEAGVPFDVSIRVGCPKCHPSGRAHHVDFVDLYADDRRLLRVQFTPGRSLPNFTCRLCLWRSVDTLRAYAQCSLHGVWLGTREITVARELPH